MSTTYDLTSSHAKYHIELIDGRETEKPLPKKLHSLVERYLIVALSRLLPARCIVAPELNVLTGGRTTDGRREYVVPDLVVVDRHAKYEDGDLAEPPLWAVEILSPGQTIGDLFIRAERLLKLGTPMVWVIWPERRKAWEYSVRITSLFELEESNKTLAGVGMELEIQLDEMWADMDLNNP
jgi:Uma2 family endonuclease